MVDLSVSGRRVGGRFWTSFHHPGSPNSCAPERKNVGLPTERQPATVLHHVDVFFLRIHSRDSLATWYVQTERKQADKRSKVINKLSKECLTLPTTALDKSLVSTLNQGVAVWYNHFSVKFRYTDSAFYCDKLKDKNQLTSCQNPPPTWLPILPTVDWCVMSSGDLRTNTVVEYKNTLSIRHGASIRSVGAEHPYGEGSYLIQLKHKMDSPY